MCVPLYVCVVSEPKDPIEHELSALDQEFAKETLQLKEWQMQELLKFRQQLHTVILTI